MSDYRIERDTLGDVEVPAQALYGAQTQRAVRNFPISGLRLPPEFIRAQAVTKWAAARANMDGGRLDPDIGGALVSAAEEILAGQHHEHFVVDVFQAGAGTSQNMNMNEVLAHRASQLLAARGLTEVRVSPNDHANMGQSTNDTIHVAIHVAAYCEIHRRLIPAAEELSRALRHKAVEFDPIVKAGRTHFQDAVPVRLGQEFGAYATMVDKGVHRVSHAAGALRELAMGGSAVGTGLNTFPGYRRLAVGYICEITGYEFVPCEDRFEAMQCFDAVVETVGALRVLVTSLRKIAADLILLSSGPRTGLSEIRLKPVQPGSSIMPGKVNPVLPEMLSMVCFHALGNDMAVVAAAQAGQLELNVMMPIIAYNLLQEIAILSGGMSAFTEHCVWHIEADEATCRRNAERSPALATALNPAIGYFRAAELAKEALDRDLLIRDLVVERGLLSSDEANQLLDVRAMTIPPDEPDAGRPGS
ncbi:MAG TPA: class II fumarate hydratase [Armatimonadota bacterium]|nr:class II fumarate hydratase [Armatimonadota bacterium]